jgi:hypothetical protein
LGQRQTSTFCTPIAPQISIYLRFRFVSDSTVDSLSGWIIDSIRIENPGCLIVGGGYVSEVNNNNDTVNLYPNPATTELIITATDKITSVSITNLLGQTVYSNNYNAEQVEVGVGDLPTGMYFVKINGSDVKKFMKE